MSSQPLNQTPVAGSLMLYKIRPAIVTAVTDKIDISLEGNKTKRVRPKDLQLLHPGPIKDFSELVDLEGNVDEAWELLLDTDTDVAELAEIVFGEYTPASAWAAWQLVAEGLYFEGTPVAILTRSSEAIESDRKQRDSKLAAEQAWDGFIQRLKRGGIEEEDRARLKEVEKLALKQAEYSRILKQLGHQEKMEHAHRLLVNVGYWKPEFNPYPQRFGLPVSDPDLPLNDLFSVERVDLSHIPAFAIDDAGSEDPDDAISLDGDMIWVHVADAASMVPADSELDLEARSRAANLYLPEGTVHMLPSEVTRYLGLGLQQESPALSIGFRLTDDAEIQDTKVVLSNIRVSRQSYSEIDKKLSEEPFVSLKEVAERYRNRRINSGAGRIELPEVSVRVIDGKVVIRSLERSGSREMVTDMMLMAGEAVGRFCLKQDIPVPFATQQPPDSVPEGEGMAAMYANRRLFKPSRNKTLEGQHAGLGLEVYSRVTSPLRRYLDLVVHQQLHAYLHNQNLLSVDEVSQRIAIADTVSATVRKAERFSNNHWKMIYLQQNSGWEGTGVVVELNDGRVTILIPELALETKIRTALKLELNDAVTLQLNGVDLPDLLPRFRIADK